jgi:hypothetical protein
MKKWRRIFQILPILLVYCFTVSFYNHNILVAKSVFLKGSLNNEEHLFSLASINLFSHAAKSENIKVQSNSAFPLSDGNDATLVVSQRAAIVMLGNRLTNFFLRCNRVVIKLPNTQIIFPFHYFF